VIVVTAIPSGKQRQKKFGRGRPTASLMASVRTPVINTENRMPACYDHSNTTLELRAMPPETIAVAGYNIKEPFFVSFLASTLHFYYF
jgi:hypothetical protein